MKQVLSYIVIPAQAGIQQERNTAEQTKPC